MKSKKAIEKFHKMLNIKKEDTDGESYVPIITKLKACQVEFNGSLSEKSCTVTEWANGEGFDFIFSGKTVNDLVASLHIDEIELMLLALHKLDYFKYTNLDTLIEDNESTPSSKRTE